MASGIALSLIAEKPVAAQPPVAVPANPVTAPPLEKKQPAKYVPRKKKKKIAVSEPVPSTPLPVTAPQIQPAQVKPKEQSAPKALVSAPKKTPKQLEPVSLSQPGSPKSTKARPRYEQNPPPTYPRLARRRGLEGIVLLDVLVDAAGIVRQVGLAKTSGHTILDKSAVKAVKKWIFHPGKLNGENIEMNVRIPINYSLQ